MFVVLMSPSKYGRLWLASTVKCQRNAGPATGGEDDDEISISHNFFSHVRVLVKFLNSFHDFFG